MDGFTSGSPPFTTNNLLVSPYNRFKVEEPDPSFRPIPLNQSPRHYSYPRSHRKEGYWRTEFDNSFISPHQLTSGNPMTSNILNNATCHNPFELQSNSTLTISKPNSLPMLSSQVLEAGSHPRERNSQNSRLLRRAVSCSGLGDSVGALPRTILPPLSELIADIKLPVERSVVDQEYQPQRSKVLPSPISTSSLSTSSRETELHFKLKLPSIANLFNELESDPSCIDRDVPPNKSPLYVAYPRTPDCRVSFDSSETNTDYIEFCSSNSKVLRERTCCYLIKAFMKYVYQRRFGRVAIAAVRTPAADLRRLEAFVKFYFACFLKRLNFLPANLSDVERNQTTLLFKPQNIMTLSLQLNFKGKSIFLGSLFSLCRSSDSKEKIVKALNEDVFPIYGYELIIEFQFIKLKPSTSTRALHDMLMDYFSDNETLMQFRGIKTLQLGLLLVDVHVSCQICELS
ncbi:hypothetical protein CANARDRAFT_173871 [[Candida] arabinofermentans NRRL YB-2248]|uniref:Uncharacterized protein n=1 Tax=[Candida] arabinofermentans NRRL YB-2248 TaxID=983967 RepID=A0A1E4T8D7_9ASCO|nr:hypothetical protein CANARDRAFT_173871 [[Candida] arabinofermentans NRRL YB-2248]